MERPFTTALAQMPLILKQKDFMFEKVTLHHSMSILSKHACPSQASKSNKGRRNNKPNITLAILHATQGDQYYRLFLSLLNHQNSVSIPDCS